MRKGAILLSILMVGEAFSACTNNSCNFKQRQLGPFSFPQTLAIGGTGPITWGPCSGPYYGLWAYILTNINSGVTAAPFTASVWVSGYGSNGFGIGTYSATCQYTVGTGAPVTVTINLTVDAPKTQATWSAINPTSYHNTCVASNSSSGSNRFFVPSNLDFCTTAGWPGGPLFNLPPQGSVYADPNFGGTVRVVKSPSFAPVSSIRVPLGDSVVSSFFSDGSLIYNNDLIGEGFATDPVSGKDIYTPPATTYPNVFTSATHPNTYYYTSGKSIYQRVLRKPPNIYNEKLIYTYPGAALNISSGNNMNVSKDEWWAFFTNQGTLTDDQKICIINLDSTNQVYCYDASGLAPLDPGGNGTSFWYPNTVGDKKRIVELSVGTSVSKNLRYVMFGSAWAGPGGGPGSFMLKFDGRSLSFLGYLPQPNNAPSRATPTYNGPHCDVAAILARNCFIMPHNAPVEINGEEYWLTMYEEFFPYMVYLVLLDPSNPDLMLTPVEEGGTARFLGVISATPQTGDTHIGCGAFAPVCVVSSNSDPRLTTYHIVGATGSGTSPIVLTLDAPWAGSGYAVLGGAQGNTAINGRWPVASSGNQLTLVGSTGNGTWTAGGAAVDAVTPPQYSNQNVVMFVDLTNPNAAAITLLANHRSWDIDFKGDGGYYGQSHCTISYQGDQVLCGTNNGIPYTYGLISMPTGYSPPPKH
jgi:hypothetical protein